MEDLGEKVRRNFMNSFVEKAVNPPGNFFYSPSGEIITKADVVSSRYMQRVLRGHVRCEQELISRLYDG